MEVFRYNAKDRIVQCYTCISVSRYAVLYRWSHFVNFLRWNGGLNRIYLRYAVLYLPPFWTSLQLSIHRSMYMFINLSSVCRQMLNRKFSFFSKISAQIISAFFENCLKKCAKVRNFFANINHCWLFLRKKGANARGRMKNVFAKIFAKTHKIRWFSPKFSRP